MENKKREYSKTITTLIVGIFSILAVGFIIFVCYEMHRQNDLSPIAYIGPTIAGVPTAVVGFYMSRAKAKSKTDLEWEKTKQLTEFREKHPEAFAYGTVDFEDIMEVIE